jgi:hypothetical protein
VYRCRGPPLAYLGVGVLDDDAAGGLAAANLAPGPFLPFRGVVS